MRKYILFTILFLAMSYHAQISTLVINNYSSYYLYGRFGANAVGGTSCFPAVNAPVDGDHIVPPGTYNLSYNYYNSNLQSPAINNWWVQTSPTSPGGTRPYYHPSLSQYGAIDTNTDWNYYWFQAKDISLNPYGDFTMGISSTCGSSSNVTYQIGMYAEAEWFNIGNYTYVQIY